MKTYLNEILVRKDLLVYLVKAGLKAEHRNTFLGYFWWLLDPLLNLLMFYFLLVIILERGGENFAVFLVIGLVAWRWTSSTINSSASAITKNTSIINQIYLPKAIFPITKSFSQLINFSFGMIIVAIFLIAFGVIPSWQIIYLPLIILIQLLFLLALSLFISYICVFIRDLENVISIFVRVMFYASPVIWDGGRLRNTEYSWIVDYNPFAYILDAYRDILMYQNIPNVPVLLSIGLCSLLAIIGLLFYYSRNEHKIIKAL
jgi:ABC-type polysaccharide/polyol phosphate export permease